MSVKPATELPIIFTFGFTCNAWSWPFGVHAKPVGKLLIATVLAPASPSSRHAICTQNINVSHDTSNKESTTYLAL